MLCRQPARRALKIKIFLLADRIEREGKHHFLPYFSRRIFFPFPHFLRSELAGLEHVWGYICFFGSDDSISRTECLS